MPNSKKPDQSNESRTPEGPEEYPWAQKLLEGLNRGVLKNLKEHEASLREPVQNGESQKPSTKVLGPALERTKGTAQALADGLGAAIQEQNRQSEPSSPESPNRSTKRLGPALEATKETAQALADGLNQAVRENIQAQEARKIKSSSDSADKPDDGR